MICERAAARKGAVLSPRFWEKPPWRRTFLAQVQGACSLLHIYSAAALFEALRADQFFLSWVSARGKEAAHAAQLRLDAEEARRASSPPPAPISDPNEAPRPRPKRGSGLRAHLS